MGGKKSSDYWPGNIAGQGAHFQGADLAGKQTFSRGHSFQLPSSSPPGTQPLTRSPAHWPSPPFPEPAPRDLAGTGPRGGLVLTSFPPLAYDRGAPRPPGARGCKERRTPTWSESHAASGRPESPLQVPAPAAVPSQARPPRRPTRGPPLPPDGREGPASPKEVSGEETGTHLPGGGAAPAELGSAGSARLGRSDSTRRPQPSRAEAPAAATRGGASETWTRSSPVSRVPLDAPACLFLRGSSSGLHLSLIGPG